MGEPAVVHEGDGAAELEADVAHLGQRVRLVAVLLLWREGGVASVGAEGRGFEPRREHF